MAANGVLAQNFAGDTGMDPSGRIHILALAG